MRKTPLAFSFACLVFLAATATVSFGHAQTEGSGTAALREVRSDGQKKLTEAQIAALTGLQVGAQVGREDLQKAADKLVATGLFATVRYDFRTRTDGLTLNFHLTESQRVPAYYDNFPWFGDSELSDASAACRAQTSSAGAASSGGSSPGRRKYSAIFRRGSWAENRELEFQ